MGIINRMATEVARRTALDNPAVSLAHPPDWVFEAFGGARSKAGTRVSERSLLGTAAVVGAIRVIADAVGQVPPILYQRKGKDRGRERATDKPAYNLMHTRPNPAMAHATFMTTAQTHILLWGGFYAEIERQGNKPVALWPLPPDKTKVILNPDTGTRVCMTHDDDGNPVGIPEPYFLHVPGWSLDGVCGLALRQIGTESLGIGLATQDHASRFFSNGARPGMVIEHPAALKDEASVKRLRDSVDRWHKGADNHYRTLVLEQNAKAHDFGFDAQASQLLESRRFAVEDISRITRVPLHKISSLERATFSNIEQQSREFLSETLQPWLVLWEEILTYELLTVAEQKAGFYFEFLREALLQMDAQGRSQLYREMFNVGSLTRNEIRERENLPPLPAEQNGDETFVPLNMVPASMASMPLTKSQHLDLIAADAEASPGGPGAAKGDNEPPGEPQEPAPAAKPAPRAAGGKVELRSSAKRAAQLRQRYHAAYVPVIAAAANRVVRRETNELRRLVDKVFGARSGSPADFIAATAEVYRALPETIRREMAPVISSLGSVVRDSIHDEVGGTAGTDINRLAAEYVGTMAERHVGISRGQLQQLADAGADGDAFRQRLDEWDQTRPMKIGTNESVRAGGFMAVNCYRDAGVQTLVWVGGGCPLCSDMNGRTTKISSPFLRGGDTVHPGDGGDAAPMPVHYDIGHPPLHGDCNCVVAAG